MHNSDIRENKSSASSVDGTAESSGAVSRARLRRQLCAWFDSSLGRSLQAFETNRLRFVLPRLHAAVALQLGALGKMDMLQSSPAPTRIVIDLLYHDHVAVVHGFPEALPLRERTVDVVLLPHTLDFAQDPHQVLREADRVLTPEGHVVILGFNPLSLWGVTRLFARRHKQVPWCGGFFSLARIKDWLSLLEYEPIQGEMLYYRPPLQNESIMDRLYFLDQVGDRWWPMMAATYLLVAKKRIFGVAPLQLRWRAQPGLGAGLSEPVARGMQRSG